MFWNCVSFLSLTNCPWSLQCYLLWRKGNQMVTLVWEHRVATPRGAEICTQILQSVGPNEHTDGAHLELGSVWGWWEHGSTGVVLPLLGCAAHWHIPGQCGRTVLVICNIHSALEFQISETQKSCLFILLIPLALFHLTKVSQSIFHFSLYNV